MRTTFRILGKILAAVAVVTLVAYGFDDLYARMRHEPYADVRVDRVFAVLDRYNEINYERTDPVMERCVYTLFPHSGHNPCWYVMRHTFRIVNVG